MQRWDLSRSKLGSAGLGVASPDPCVLRWAPESRAARPRLRRLVRVLRRVRWVGWAAGVEWQT